MRLPTFVVYLFCGLILGGCVSSAIGEDGANQSTIRLTSFTEPATTQASPETAEQPAPQSSDEAASTATASHADEDPSPAPATASEPSPASEAEAAPPVVNRPRMPAGLYPNAAARAVLSRMPGPVPVQSAPRVDAAPRGNKPFQSFQRQPTISPYLYLNAGAKDTNTMMNYYALVRPQLDQADGNRQQPRDVRQLRSQLRKMSAASAVPAQPISQSTVGHYMDTAQFYRGLQR